MISLWVILIVFLALLIEGFYSGSELALLSVDRIQMKKLAKSGSAGAKLVLRMLKNPERVLSCTLIMTSTCIMTITVLLTLEFRKINQESGEWMAVMVGSTLVILFGELLPKFIYRKFSVTIAPRVASTIFFTQKVLSPLIHLTTLYTSQISKVIIPLEKIWGGKRQSIKDDLHFILAGDSSDTQIKSNEQRLIRKILRFRDKTAKDGMIPLVQVDVIENTFSIADSFEIYHQTKHSRLPVYEERVDNIIGILELNSVIRQNDAAQDIARFVRKPFYVPETQPLESLLNDMIEDEEQLAVVVDEYGGAVGILTREDLFEQIVGDLEDEDDPEVKSIREVKPNLWLIKASASVIKINEELHLDLPEGDYDTLSGFLLRQFSRIPDPGDELYFDTRAGQIHFIIREANSRKIETVAIERIVIKN